MTEPSHFMQRALDIARPHRTHPNPKVGCVLVVDDVVVGEGAHHADGGAHAEAHAVLDAGAAAAGATAYVTLEPCNHVGRTPACTGLLIEAGIRDAVVAVLDPDPRVAGAGVRRLESAGIPVRVGLLMDEAIELDRAYHHHRRTGRPYTVGLVDIDPEVPARDLDLALVDLADDPVQRLHSDELAGIVSLGIVDVATMVQLDSSGILDAVVFRDADLQAAGLGEFVTVATTDSIGSYSLARRTEDVHRNH